MHLLWNIFKEMLLWIPPTKDNFEQNGFNIKHAKTDDRSDMLLIGKFQNGLLVNGIWFYENNDEEL